MAVIRKTRSGKYELDFYIGMGRKRVTFQTRREAEEAKRALFLPASAADQSKLKPQTLKDAIRFYTDTASVGKASKKNEKAYFTRLYKSLKGQGAVMVHEVTVMMLETFRAERLKTCKGSTVNREFNTYRHFFSKCVDWEAIAVNPCEKIEAAPEKKNPRRVWTDEEFKTVVAHLPPWAADVMTAMYWTGGGPTEISRVTWADVNFETSQLLLKRYKGTGDELRRWIDMPPDFVTFMRAKYEFARRSFKAKASDFAFLNSRNNQINARPLSTQVRRVVVALGLPDGTVPYGIRHKFATELLEANVGEDQVRKLMGHRSVKTLIENYSHVGSKALKEAMGVRAKQAAKITWLETKRENGRTGR